MMAVRRMWSERDVLQKGRALMHCRRYNVIALGDLGFLYLPLRRSEVCKRNLKFGLFARPVLEKQLRSMLLASTVPRRGQRFEDVSGLDPEAANGCIYSSTLRSRGPLLYQERVLVTGIQQFLELVVVTLELSEESLAVCFAVAEF